jgi:hypothetical protein
VCGNDGSKGSGFESACFVRSCDHPILSGTHFSGMLNHETLYAGLFWNAECVWCSCCDGHCYLSVGLSHLIWSGLSLLLWYVYSMLCVSKAVFRDWSNTEWQQRVADRWSCRWSVTSTKIKVKLTLNIILIHFVFSKCSYFLRSIYSTR